VGPIIPAVSHAVGMGSQSWGSDYNDEGSNSNNAIGAFFGALLLLCGFAWWALNVALRDARFWPFAITLGGIAWFLLEGGRNRFPVFGWLLVGLVVAAFYVREFGEGKGRIDRGTNPSSLTNATAKKATHTAAPDNVFKCNNCGAALGSMERGLCGSCRSPGKSVSIDSTPLIANIDNTILEKVSLPKESQGTSKPETPSRLNHISKNHAATLVNRSRNTPASGKLETVPEPSHETVNSWRELCESVDGAIIVTMRQYEGGPWWSRAFFTKDLLAYYLMRATREQPLTDESNLIREAMRLDAEIADRFVDDGISPLVESVADSREISIKNVRQSLPANLSVRAISKRKAEVL
jgi:hypothetical protein